MTKRLCAGILALGFAAAACDGSATGPEGNGLVTVTMAEGAGSAAATSAASSAFGLEAAEGNVPMEEIGSINVTITGVEVLRTGGDAEGSDAGWVSVAVEGGSVTVDLLALSEDGVALAEGELEPGDYRNVRLFFSDAEIVLEGEVSLGAQTFEPGTYELFIPSGDQTGIKVPTETFTVAEEGATVTVLSDTEASVRTVNVTGNGFLMTPVLTAETGQGGG